METLRQDLSYAVRMLLKNPGFTAVAILSLAIGIGANSAIFSVTDALLLRPLPYKDADRLAILWNRSPGLNIAQDWFSPGMYLDVKTQNQVFDDVAIAIGGSFNMTGQGRPERVDGARVSSSFFPALGASPSHGRLLLPEEDEPGKPQVVILGNGFWQRRFASDPEVIGKSLILNGNSFTIVGITAPEFYLNKEVMPAVNGIRNADILLPLPMSESARTDRGHEDYNIFAKLKPGVSLRQAQAEMDVIAGRMKQQYPGNYPPTGGLTISVVPLLDQVVGDIRLALYVLFGAVGFVLLIACVNVANLLLARATVRQKEIAIRQAVGAGRIRILRQLLTESILLSIAGGLVGFAVALLAVRTLRLFGPENIPRLNGISVDTRAIGFTFVISLVTGVVFGLAPALRASRVDLNKVLKDGGRTSTGGGTFGRGHYQIRNLLVIAEVALSLVLLIGAGLLIRSYKSIAGSNPGFDPHNVLSLRLSLPNMKYATADDVSTFYKRLDERVRALPGIEYFGANYQLPLSSVSFAWEPVSVAGYEPKEGENLIIASSGYTSPDYFRAMGIKLIKGRFFDEHDKKGSQEVAIVDDKFAERFWKDEDALGKRMRQGDSGPWRIVVGVVADEREYGVETEPPITVYFPVEQFRIGSRFLVARTTSDPAQLTQAITQEIEALDPELPVYDVSTMEERLYDSLARQRFSMFLLGVFAVFAMILAAIGIYGVMAYSVNQRTHEIGIRMALGAQSGNILRLVIRQAFLLVSVGIAIGITGAFALTRVMSGLLYGVSATDGFTFALTALLLGATALPASYVPARRASRVDPMVALRYE